MFALSPLPSPVCSCAELAPGWGNLCWCRRRGLGGTPAHGGGGRAGSWPSPWSPWSLCPLFSPRCDVILAACQGLVMLLLAGPQGRSWDGAGGSAWGCGATPSRAAAVPRAGLLRALRASASQQLARAPCSALQEPCRALCGGSEAAGASGGQCQGTRAAPRRGPGWRGAAGGERCRQRALPPAGSVGAHAWALARCLPRRAGGACRERAAFPLAPVWPSI